MFLPIQKGKKIWNFIFTYISYREKIRNEVFSWEDNFKLKFVSKSMVLKYGIKLFKHG
jgi:hypothetical protein